MQAKYGFDAKGNRRYTIASIWDNGWQPVGEENWYQYNAANNMTISQGICKEGSIQIAPGKGTCLLYDVAGRRSHEITNKKGKRSINSILV